MAVSALSLLALLLATRGAGAQTGPVIERIEPTSGPPGTRVSIVGRRFGNTPAVTLGSSPVTVFSSLPNRITVSIANDSRSGLVTVTTEAGSVRGPEFRVTPPPPAAKIESLEPAAGPPGSAVKLRGQNFSPRLTGNVVTLGGLPVVVRSATPAELVVTVPAGASSNTFLVRVQGAPEVASGRFEVTTATAVTSVQPQRGGAGSVLTIRGTGFSKVPSGNRVYLNSVALTVKSATETELVVELPHKVASGKVLVDVQGAGRAYGTEPFVVQRPPNVTSFSPKKGPPGTKVVVRGTNFGELPGAIDARISDAKLLVREARDTSVTLEIPEGAPAGKISIRVHGVGPAWSDGSFAAVATLKVTGFAPQSGPSGSEVTIEGQGFDPSPAGNRVLVGGQAARVLSANPTQLKVRVPAGKSGPIEVSVAGSGQFKTSKPFVILEAPAPAPPY